MRVSRLFVKNSNRQNATINIESIIIYDNPKDLSAMISITSSCVDYNINRLYIKVIYQCYIPMLYTNVIYQFYISRLYTNVIYQFYISRLYIKVIIKVIIKGYISRIYINRLYMSIGYILTVFIHKYNY